MNAPIRVLHVLHHSTPYLDGYGIRSESIVRFQRAWGVAPTAVTSAHHEIEVKRPAGATPPPETIDGVTYHRTPLPAGRGARLSLRTPFLRERTFMKSLEATLERVVSEGGFDLIHAHSPVLCGLPALRVARRHGLPLVYEVRAFWEDALLNASQTPARRLKYAYSRRLETSLLQRADAVVAISRRMVDEICSRGVPRRRLHHVGNGVDTARFAPQGRDPELASRLALPHGLVIGFIGSFFRFEGLDCLVRAMPAILERLPGARLLLVGTGEAADEIAALVRELGLGASVVQVGRVPHEDILRYYSVIDALVYPRLRDRVTDLVTPLKPLEALSLGKPVLGSDVGGITELLDDGNVGQLFRAGDSADLAEQVVALLRDDRRRRRLSEEGRAYVLARRNWPVVARSYAEIYRSVLTAEAVQPERAYRAQGMEA